MLKNPKFPVFLGGASAGLWIGHWLALFFPPWGSFIAAYAVMIAAFFFMQFTEGYNATEDRK